MSQLNSTSPVSTRMASHRRGFIKTVLAGGLSLPALLKKSQAAEVSPSSIGTPAYLRATPQVVPVGTFRTHSKSPGIPASSASLLPPVDYDRIRDAVVAGNLNANYQTNRLGMVARLQFGGWSGQIQYAQAMEARLKSLSPNASLARDVDGSPLFVGFLAAMSPKFTVKNSFAVPIGGGHGTGYEIFAFDQRPLLQLIAEGGNAPVCMATVGTYHPTISNIGCPQCLDVPKKYEDLDIPQLTPRMGYTDGQMIAVGSSKTLAGIRTPAVLVMGAEDGRLAELWSSDPSAPRIGAGSFAYIAPAASEVVPIGLKVAQGKLYEHSPETTLVSGIAELSIRMSSPWASSLTLRGSKDPLAWQGLNMGTLTVFQNLEYAGFQEVLVVAALVLDSAPVQSAPPQLSILRTPGGVKLRVVHKDSGDYSIGVYQSLASAQGTRSPDRVIALGDGKSAGDVTEIVRRPEFETEFYKIVSSLEGR